MSQNVSKYWYSFIFITPRYVRFIDFIPRTYWLATLLLIHEHRALLRFISHRLIAFSSISMMSAISLTKYICISLYFILEEKTGWEMYFLLCSVLFFIGLHATLLPLTLHFAISFSQHSIFLIIILLWFRRLIWSFHHFRLSDCFFTPPLYDIELCHTVTANDAVY